MAKAVTVRQRYLGSLQKSRRAHSPGEEDNVRQRKGLLPSRRPHVSVSLPGASASTGVAGRSRKTRVGQWPPFHAKSAKGVGTRALQPTGKQATDLISLSVWVNISPAHVSETLFRSSECRHSGSHLRDPGFRLDGIRLQFFNCSSTLAADVLCLSSPQPTSSVSAMQSVRSLGCRPTPPPTSRSSAAFVRHACMPLLCWCHDHVRSHTLHL
jgi:hypothetical protein